MSISGTCVWSGYSSGNRRTGSHLLPPTLTLRQLPPAVTLISQLQRHRPPPFDVKQAHFQNRKLTPSHHRCFFIQWYPSENEKPRQRNRVLRACMCSDHLTVATALYPWRFSITTHQCRALAVAVPVAGKLTVGERLPSFFYRNYNLRSGKFDITPTLLMLCVYLIVSIESVQKNQSPTAMAAAAAGCHHRRVNHHRTYPLDHFDVENILLMGWVCKGCNLDGFV